MSTGQDIFHVQVTPFIESGYGPAMALSQRVCKADALMYQLLLGTHVSPELVYSNSVISERV